MQPARAHGLIAQMARDANMAEAAAVTGRGGCTWLRGTVDMGIAHGDCGRGYY